MLIITTVDEFFPQVLVSTLADDETSHIDCDDTMLDVTSHIDFDNDVTEMRRIGKTSLEPTCK